MEWLDAFGNATTGTVPAEIVRPPGPERGTHTAAELGLPERMDGDGPFVSVVIATYRDSHCLPEALQSISAQTHTNLELVLVDSSSVSWLEALADEREWVRYLSQRPRGISAARNDGIEAARGTFVALLDADDYWHPAKLERQVRVLERQQAAVSFSDYYVVDVRREPPSVVYRDRTYDTPATAASDRLARPFAHTSTLVVRRDAIAERPFEESLRTREDLAFVVELFRRHRPVHVGSPLAVHRKRPGSVTDRAGVDRAYEDQRAVVAYLSSACPELAGAADRRLARSAYSAGKRSLAANDGSRARAYLGKRLRASPLDYRALALYATSLLPIDGASAVEALDRLHDRLAGRDENEVTVV